MQPPVLVDQLIAQSVSCTHPALPPGDYTAALQIFDWDKNEWVALGTQNKLCRVIQSTKRQRGTLSVVATVSDNVARNPLPPQPLVRLPDRTAEGVLKLEEDDTHPSSTLNPCLKLWAAPSSSQSVPDALANPIQTALSGAVHNRTSPRGRERRRRPCRHEQLYLKGPEPSPQLVPSSADAGEEEPPSACVGRRQVPSGGGGGSRPRPSTRTGCPGRLGSSS